MKVMLAPDIHCFEPAYGQVEPSTGQNTRLSEWNTMAFALHDVAVRKEVDIVIFPGDFFVNARPLPVQILAVTSLFTNLEEAGIKVVAYQGNHDDLGSRQISPCGLVSEIGLALGHENWAVNGPSVVEVLGIRIAVLPFMKVPDTHGNPKAIADALLKMVGDLRSKCGSPCILTGHWSIEGALASSEQIMGGNEPIIPFQGLLDLKYDAYMFGHIHKPQKLNTLPFVGYSGALQRRDFGEERDPRGCYIIDLKTGYDEWVDIPAQEFLTLKYPNVEALCRVFDDASQAAGKIVRVKYRAHEGEVGSIDHGEIIKSLESAGAILVKGVFPEIIRSDRVRAEITEGTKPIEALNKWLETRGLDEKLTNKVAAEADKLLDQIQAIEIGGAAA